MSELQFEFSDDDKEKALNFEKKIDEEFERSKASNPHNYTNLQLASKERMIRNYQKEYPTIPAKWIDWCYDILHSGKIPIEDIREKINSGEWEKKKQVKNTQDQVIEGLTIYKEDEFPTKKE